MACTNCINIQGNLKVGLSSNIYGEGYMWYNTINCKLQFTTFRPKSRTWSAGDNVNCAVRSQGSGGIGYSAVKTMGKNGSGTLTTNTEEWGGSSWSNGGNTPVALCQIATNGAQEYLLATGGRNSSGTEQIGTYLYNGSTWSTTDNLTNCRTMMGAAGGSWWALVAGGYRASGNVTLACTEEYDRFASWSNESSLPIALCQTALVGSNQCTISYGGKNTGGAVVNCLFFRGSNGLWSTGPGSSTNRCNHALSNQGNDIDFIVFGGSSQPGGTISSTEAFNGISWSTCVNMNTGRKGGGYGSGNGCLALANSGYTPTFLSTSEEFCVNGGPTSANLWIYDL